ncbi:MAG: Rrf2 family transcriptional regulator [Spirochaetales bacterium]|nr:Rrf2 family transcriptional regulator [Leptospiraceae bacterium]MCP5480132.1 Rrf2 family transcriptional regulator [Spirochaetales bacterium]MCP5485528.1 Rrf2 family transcriptional regulator [Spirochaetales bacterium]
MRITSKGRYGLKAMMELARTGDDETLLKTREIAENQSIPLKYLEQIINILKKHNLVTSVRGSDGGYRLARTAAEITVYEILNALEGDLSVVDKDDPSWGHEQGVFWQDLENRIRRILEVPLSDFTEANREAEQGLMYYI